MAIASRILGLLLLVATLSGCGPTDEEIGQAVLRAAPGITVVAAAIAWLYTRLWWPLIGEVRFSWRPAFWVGGIQVAISLATLFHFVGDPELDLIAFWAVGTSFLSLQVICLRVAVMAGTGRALSRTYLLPWVLLYPLAPYLGFSGLEESGLGALALFLWIAPGWAGWVSGPLAVILFAEVLVRRHQLAARLREEARPSPLPEARVVVRDEGSQGQ